MKLKDKVVIVTGAGKGIGKSIALAFAKEGANVVINFRKDKAAGAKTFAETNLLGGDNLLIQADVSKEAEVKSMFENIAGKYKTADILINCAGDAESIDFISSPLLDWEYQMDNNYLSAVIVSKEFLRLNGLESVENVEVSDLKKIINISSVWGMDDKCQKKYMGYGASKAAINSLTKNMAKTFAPKILVNAIAPGYVMTPHWGKMTEKEVNANANEQLIERFIEPEEIAEGVIFMAKNDSMTGTVLLMDGGISLKTI